MNRSMFIAALVTVAIFGTIIIFGDAIWGQRNWIDLCVVEQWETTGEHHLGVRDYCLAKYRQTR